MLKIRLRRMGKRHRPFYRLVVSDSRSVPGAPAVEEIGHYDPMVRPPQVKIDLERIEHWVGQGARMSPSVRKLVKGVRTGKHVAAAPAVPAVTEEKATAAAPVPAEVPAEATETEAKAEETAAAATEAKAAAEATEKVEEKAAATDETPAEEEAGETAQEGAAESPEAAAAGDDEKSSEA
jgi:small subunit ribosomal protein S16